ncbi:hypothetical protein AXG93_3444s1050 [Marchantia polymorpha subsp. ruderalis]|uniref:Uncharacterized protein n=1 Tax=Marchantia polymorpha subsp. ruderalis TaxID=1480154 RepID=A0A176VXN7_MARPO|nr:hypothetical protein AXG93_3444s1050 [Marchantia polymorpha subsp. ruderalis]
MTGTSVNSSRTRSPGTSWMTGYFTVPRSSSSANVGSTDGSGIFIVDDLNSALADGRGLVFLLLQGAEGMVEFLQDWSPDLLKSIFVLCQSSLGTMGTLRRSDVMSIQNMCAKSLLDGLESSEEHPEFRGKVLQ